MIISCDFGFRRRVGKCILLRGFLGFCLLSGKSGFFRFTLLFGKPFLLGTLLGYQSFGFRLASVSYTHLSLVAANILTLAVLSSFAPTGR